MYLIKQGERGSVHLIARLLHSRSTPSFQVLVESSYSGQFGTFLLNNEQERQEVC